MTAPKYLLAKYIPDLMRQEPRNIGVILWSNGAVTARFLAEREDRPEIDGRSIPSFVTSPSAYKQWIEYWRGQLAQDTITDPRAQHTAGRSSADFLEILKTSNKGNFILTDGGILMEPVPAENMPETIDDLFLSLVEDYSLQPTSEMTLLESCEELLESTHLVNSPYFKSDFQIDCEIKGAKDEYTFSYAFQNGHLGKLYQRVSLPKKKKELVKKNVRETAWMFEKVIEAHKISQSDTAALVYATPEQRADPDTANLLGVLNSVTRVINLQSDAKQLAEEFKELAAYMP